MGEIKFFDKFFRASGNCKALKEAKGLNTKFSKNYLSQEKEVLVAIDSCF